jgi:hypothetical protein
VRRPGRRERRDSLKRRRQPLCSFFGDRESCRKVALGQSTERDLRPEAL